MNEDDHSLPGLSRPASTRAPAPAPAPTQEPPPPHDDAGSQALGAALHSSFAIIKLIMIGLVILFLGSGIFTVGSQERAVILRFGKPVMARNGDLLGPGLHWAYPYPIDEVVKITNAQIQTVTSRSGWYGITPEEEMAGTEPGFGASLNPASDGYTLTADGNIIHVRATLQYRIDDPLTYVFQFTNAAAVVQHALDNALFHASLNTSVDDALRRDVEGFKEKIRARVEQQVRAHRLGITLEPLTIKTLAPRQLKEDFDKVQTAEQDVSRRVNEAQGYANTNLSAARGTADARVHAGITRSNQIVQSVAAEADRFTKILPEYQRNPEVFRQRLLTETLQRVLTNVNYKFIYPQRSNAQPGELRLELNREPQRRRAPVAP